MKKTSIPVADAHLSESELSDVLDSRFTKYAFMSLEDRALPDARDGLKPSQRRVLVAMNDLKLYANSATEKCAKICGDTSGNYHPHGEAIVYPTLCRMVQSWILRYPLLLGQGNFGNVDGDPSAAMRYCVTGDSLINVGGFKELRFLSQNENVDLRVESIDKINSASKWFDCGKHPVKTINTRFKYSITGTDNHPLLVLMNDESGPSLGWKLIQELVIGDKVVLKRGNSLWALSKIDLKSYHPHVKNYSNYVNKYTLPEVMDENLAFVLGALVAEGTISGNEKLNFINSNKRFFSKYQNSWKKCFAEWNCPKYERKNDLLSSDSCGVYLRDFLTAIGLPSAIARDKEIPFTILSSPKKVISSFLSALYEGDGGVCIGPRASFEITLNSQSLKLVKQVQILLLGFGIASTWYHDIKRDIYKLIIKDRENYQKFEREIGFVTKQKKLRVKAAILYTTGKSLSKKDYIPYLSNFVRTKAIRNREFLSSHNFDRIKNWNLHKNLIKNSLCGEDFDLCEKITRGDFLYDEVTSIIDGGTQNVYSIRVDSDCHSFVANGFINHNTESRLSSFGEELLDDLSPEVVPFQPNYNEKRQEPTILPSRFPNLIVNGAEGIAVGWATKMLPHNLKEVTAVIKEYIKNPAVKAERLLKLMPGPDFPTGGKLLGQDGVLEYYKTGRGTIRLEGTYEVSRDNKGNQFITVTELPYQASPDLLCTEVQKLVENDKKGTNLNGITDLKNLSSKKTGIRVVIEVAKTANVNVVLNNLLKQTCLRKSMSVNTTVLIGGKVVPEATLLQLVKAFVEHRQAVLTAKFKAEKVKAEARIHILEGLLGIVDKIDAVIKLIRSSETDTEAEQALISKKFVQSMAQAKAVMAITLRQLTKLEGKKLLDESNALKDRLAWLKKVLSSETEILNIISEEQTELAKKLGDDRRTKIEGTEETIADEDLIKDEQLIISMTGDGYVKSIPTEAFKVQGRGGQGVAGKSDNTESIFKVFEANSKHLVLFFTNKGLMYQRRCFEIPQGSKTSKGTHVNNLLSLGTDEKITSMLSVKSVDQDGFLVIVTKNGVIKKTEIREYDTNRKTGVTAISLGMGDEVAFVNYTDGKQDICIITEEGYCVRYNERIVPVQGRSTRGSRGLKLDYDDLVAEVLTFAPKSNPDIFVVTRSGFGKKTTSEEYEVSKTRVVRGVHVMKRTPAMKGIAGACAVSKGDSILVLTSSGKCLRLDASDVRATGRTTQGVCVVKLTGDETVLKAAKVSQVE